MAGLHTSRTSWSSLLNTTVLRVHATSGSHETASIDTQAATQLLPLLRLSVAGVQGSVLDQFTLSRCCCAAAVLALLQVLLTDWLLSTAKGVLCQGGWCSHRQHQLDCVTRASL